MFTVRLLKYDEIIRAESQRRARQKPLEKRETNVRLTFQELETLLALCEGVQIEASQSELWWHMNNLEVKLLEAKSRVQGDVFGNVIDNKAKEDRKTQ